jgi:soluble lytic murein transglycosylase-like protein
MPHSLNIRFVPLLVAGLGASAGLFAGTTGDPAAKGTSPYQLQLAGPSDYRLPGQRPVRAIAAQQPQYESQPYPDKPFAREIDTAARRNNLDPALVHAVIQVESGHRANAVSPKGAIGLMQLMPETAERFGVAQPSQPEANLAAGTRYLRTLLDLFDQRLDLALAAYNAGEGAVIRHRNQIPPYRETREYVPAVLGKYEGWRQGRHPRIVYLQGTLLDGKAMPVPQAIEDR